MRAAGGAGQLLLMFILGLAGKGMTLEEKVAKKVRELKKKS